MNLFEGNIIEEPIFADYWGPSGPGNTLFRNRVSARNIGVYDHSHYSNIIGNELTGAIASIIIHDKVLNTWSHSNNVNGLIANSCAETAPASLYLSQIPTFLEGLSFPVFGFDEPLGVNTVRAKQRYDVNEIMSCPAPCHEYYAVEANDVNAYENIRTIASQAVIPAPESINYMAGDCIIMNQNFEVKSGATFLADIIACPE